MLHFLWWLISTPFLLLWDALLSLWNGQGNLSDFTSLLEATFGLSLAYSVLLHFSTFSGGSLENWADDEKVRVIPALAETDKFDESRFTGDIDGLEDRCLLAITVVNTTSLIWCIIGAIVSFYLIAYAGFYPETEVSLQDDWFAILVACGSVPLGLLSLISIHLVARHRMRCLSKDFKGLMKYNKQLPAAQVSDAREALRKRLKEAREAKKS